MKRSTIALSSMVILVASRAADAAVTYHYTPDLKHEMNPLVSVLGLGWPALVVGNVVLCGFALWCTAYWWRHPLGKEAAIPTESVWAFASYCYFGRVYPFWTFRRRQLYRMPYKWRHCVQLVGFVLSPLISAGSMFMVLAWLSKHTAGLGWFYEVYSATFPWGWCVAFAAAYYLLEALFYYLEWRAYLRESHHDGQCPNPPLQQTGRTWRRSTSQRNAWRPAAERQSR